MLDFRRLRYFTAIAEHGSLSSAARALHVSQPALSHHLAALEDELGTQLLIRQPRGVQLTASGRLLHDRAVVILRLLEDAEAEVRRNAPKAAARVLNVAVIPSIAPLITASLFAIGDQILPGLSARITEARTEYGHMLVQSGELDIAISQGDPSWRRTAVVAREPFFLVSPVQGPKPESTITLDAVLAKPLILPTPQNPLRRMFDETLSKLGRRAITLMEVDGLEAVKHMVTEKIGSAVLNWAGVYEENKKGTLYVQMIIEPAIYRNLTIEHSAATNDADVQAFTEIVRNILQNTLYGGDAQFDRFMSGQT